MTLSEVNLAHTFYIKDFIMKICIHIQFIISFFVTFEPEKSLLTLPCTVVTWSDMNNEISVNKQGLHRYYVVDNRPSYCQEYYPKNESKK